VPLTDDRHNDGSPSAVWFTICAWCARMKLGGRWIDVEPALELLGTVDDLRLTHGICTSCFEETATRADRERRARTDRHETGSD
jgi:NMD protein affecting ribosome stability and mRNA decay